MQLFIWHWQHFDLIALATDIQTARANIAAQLNLADDFAKYKPSNKNVDLFALLYTEPEIITADYSQIYLRLDTQWKQF